MTATPPSAIPDAALRLLVERGFDATSVDQLASAAGISRSTFFRRFGTKEDMVFADVDAVIGLVEGVLQAGRGRPADAVVDAALAVFDHHTSRPEASLLRHRLLQEVPALRDRELVSTHRYERTFKRGLDGAFGAGDSSAADGRSGVDGAGAGIDDGSADGGSASIAFAAAVVAVHNAFLRRWLRRPDAAVRMELERELRNLARLFAPLLAGRRDSGGASRPIGTNSASGPAAVSDAVPPLVSAPATGPTVVVTVLDAGAGTAEIIAAVREALPHA